MGMALALGISAVLSACAGGTQDKEDRGVRLSASPGTTLKIEGRAEDLVLHDLNGDGYLDLIVAVYGKMNASQSAVFLSAKGRFEKASWNSPATGSWMAAAVGDLRGTGAMDLVLVNYHSDPEGEGAAAAFANDGKGGFGEAPFWTTHDWSDRDQANKVIVGDFNRDGRPDVLLAGMYGTMSLCPRSQD